MHNTIAFVVFLTVFLSVFFGMHYYAYIHVAKGFLLAGNARWLLRLFFLSAGLSFVLGEFISRRAYNVFLKFFEFSGTVWLGTLSIAVSVFLVFDILRIFFRSQAFIRQGTLFCVLLITVLSSYALFNGTRLPSIREIKIKTGRLARPEPLSIVHLTDIHINNYTSPTRVAKIVEMTNSLDPDAVFITGDLVDANLCETKTFSNVLKELRARYGVFAVTGNHEFYAGMENFICLAESSGIKAIRNSFEKAGGLIIMGIDDDISSRGPGALPVLEEVFAKIAPEDKRLPAILLSHRPDTFDAAQKLGVLLQLSGHTHAGQIPPMDIIVRLAFKYPIGLYKKGDSWCYTSPGTNYWGPPMRLFSKNEITRIVIEKE
ncbi:MAG: metallophosphoesterase [Endomicrobiales bacterium]|nr:metallophosphoesterase [Endomicrobiales bacterium]